MKQSSGKNRDTPGGEIAKITVKRFVKLKHDISLQDGFWNDPLWKKTFAQHCIAANALLKIYSFEAILWVLNKYPTLWSLRAKFIEDDLIRAQRKIDTRPLPQPAPVNISDTPTFRTNNFGSKHGKEEE